MPTEIPTGCRNPACEKEPAGAAELAEQLARAALHGQGDAFALMLAGAVALRGYCSQECWVATEPETWPEFTERPAEEAEGVRIDQTLQAWADTSERES